MDFNFVSFNYVKLENKELTELDICMCALFIFASCHIFYFARCHNLLGMSIIIVKHTHTTLI